MYNGIGLVTPRGSATNGYIQKNLAFINNLKEKPSYKSDKDISRADAAFFKEPNKEILEHERKRKIEVKCFELEQQMEDQGYTPVEIIRKVGTVRKALLEELKVATNEKHEINMSPFEFILKEEGKFAPKGTHEIAAVNVFKNSVFKEALGIGLDFQDGNSLELSNQKKKDDAETKRLLDISKDMKTLDSSDENIEDDKSEKRKHRKKSKKRKRNLSVSDASKSDSNSAVVQIESRSHKSHKSSKNSHSKRSKHSHSKEKRHH